MTILGKINCFAEKKKRQRKKIKAGFQQNSCLTNFTKNTTINFGTPQIYTAIHCAWRAWSFGLIAPVSDNLTEFDHMIQSTLSKTDTFGTGTKCPS